MLESYNMHKWFSKLIPGKKSYDMMNGEKMVVYREGGWGAEK